MEELNKTQIVLLTLLVSFVTSIATGIVTVALMDQAPPGLTQTINRVVEKTVEIVVPEETQGATVIKTVVVKEEDFITEAIEINSPSLVTIKNEKDITVSFGFLIDNGDFIVSDTRTLKDGSKYQVIFDDQEVVEATVVVNDKNNYFSILKVIYPEDFDRDSLQSKSAELEEVDTLSLGQSIVALGTKTEEKIFLGVVIGFKEGDIILENKDTVATSSSESLNRTPSLIRTSLGLNQYDSGGPSLNTAGKIVGINIVIKDFRYTIPSQIIRRAIENLPQT